MVKFKYQNEVIEVPKDLLKAIDKAHKESEDRLKAIEEEEADDWMYAD